MERGRPSAIYLWSGSRPTRLAGYDDYVTQLAFSPSGHFVAAVGTAVAPPHPGSVKVWNISSGHQNARIVASINDHTTTASHVAFSPNQSLLASADFDGVVLLSRLERSQQPVTPSQSVTLTIREHLPPHRVVANPTISIEKINSQVGGRNVTLQPIRSQPKHIVPGQYVVALPPAKYRVTIGAEGYESVSVRVVVSDEPVQEAVLLKRMTLPVYPVLLVVRDEQLKPVDNVTFNIPSISDRPESVGDATYKYELRPGVYEVTISKPNYVSTTRKIGVEDGPFRAEFLLSMTPTPAYPVVLTVQDDQQRPIPGATVAIDGSPTQANDNADGTYGYELASGDYEFTLSKAGYQPVTHRLRVSDEPVRETVILPESPSPGYPMLLTIQDDKERPLADATIEIVGIDFGPSSVRGGVSEYRLEPGSYQVNVRRPGYQPVTRLIRVSDEPVRETIQLVAIPVPTGTFELALNVVDREGQPLSGLQVISDPGIIVKSQDDQGAYTLQLRPAIYEFTASADGLEYPPGRLEIVSSDLTVIVTPLQQEDVQEHQLKALHQRMDSNRDRFLDAADFPADGWKSVVYLDKNQDDEIQWQELRPFLDSQPSGDDSNPRRPPTSGAPRGDDDDARPAAELRSRLDRNKDGTIDRNDFPEAGWQDIVQRLGKENSDQLSDDDLQKIFQPVDPVPQSEKQPRVPAARTESTRLDQLHARLDFNRSGSVDQNDFPDSGWAAASTLDLDKDKVLSRNELKPLLEPTQADRPSVPPNTDEGPNPRRGTLVIKMQKTDDIPQ